MNGLKLVIGSPNVSSWSLAALAAAEAAAAALRGGRHPACASRTPARGSAATRRPARCRCCWWAGCGSGTRWRSPNSWPRTIPSLWPADPRAARVGAGGRLRDAQRLCRLAYLPAHGLHRPLRPARAGCWPPVEADIERIVAIWTECRRAGGGAGPFLFGAFSIADAMFAPVCSRFTTYAVPLEPASEAYVEPDDGPAGDAGMGSAGRRGPSVAARPGRSRADRRPDRPATSRHGRRCPTAAVGTGVQAPAPEPEPAPLRAPRRRRRPPPSRRSPPPSRRSRPSAPRSRRRAAARPAADPVDDHGQAHRGRNSATTLR